MGIVSGLAMDSITLIATHSRNKPSQKKTKKTTTYKYVHPCVTVMYLSKYLERFDVYLALLGYLCVSSMNQYFDHFNAYLALMRYQCVTENNKSIP